MLIKKKKMTEQPGIIQNTEWISLGSETNKNKFFHLAHVEILKKEERKRKKEEEKITHLCTVYMPYVLKYAYLKLALANVLCICPITNYIFVFSNLEIVEALRRAQSRSN